MGQIRTVIFLLCAGYSMSVAASTNSPAALRMLGGADRPFQIGDLPKSRLQNRLQSLPESARNHAISRLQTFEFPPEDANVLNADDAGDILYACEFPSMGASDGDDAPVQLLDEPMAGPVPVFPFPDHLKFSSRPGATNVIFLDFDGHTVTGTAWNVSLDRTQIVTRVFSTDSDTSTYSDSEQAIIKRAWQRVAEDFAPFNVNVTTEEPPAFHNRVAHALITRNYDVDGLPNPSTNAGGVAYVNVFGANNLRYYSPAWVYHNNLSNSEGNIAEATSHEIGHNLGLSHDGKTDGTTYYSGHGSGVTSWAPIMGSSYNKSVSQWSKGEYYLANNTQDDLSIIAGKLTYRPDDVANQQNDAPYLLLVSNRFIHATTPETDPDNTVTVNKGVIGQNTDADMWAFTTGSGSINLSVRPWVSTNGSRGGNLDAKVSLINSAGNIIATNDPTTETIASVQAVVSAGIYYLRIENSSFGNPTSSTPSGFTKYASIGQYFVTGVVQDASGVIIAPSAALISSLSVTSAGATSYVFSVRYSDNLAVSTATIDDNDVYVTGPGIFSAPARLQSIDQVTDGSPRTATYVINAPGGSWDSFDNGVYSIWIVSQAVADVEGAYVPAGILGSFTSSIPKLVYSATMDVFPGWTLGGLWSYGKPNGNSGDPSAGATGTNVIGYNLNGNYERNLAAVYATTPPFSCAGVQSVALQFKRWLGVRSGDTAILQISTESLSWTTIWSSSGQINESSWQSVQYDITAIAAGKTNVQIRWGMGSNSDTQVRHGWNIDDVEIYGVFDAIDTLAPDVAISAPDVYEGGGETYLFTVQYEDDTGVDTASINNQNFTITWPGGFVTNVSLDSISGPVNGSPQMATYAVIPPGGSWGEEDNGSYTLRLDANTIQDNYGNTFTTAVTQAFLVQISTPTSVLGAVTCRLMPEMAVTLGAAWSLANSADPEWRSSGDAIGGLEPGSYTVLFKPISGWVTPDNVAVSITAGVTNALEAAYAAITTSSHDVPVWWLNQYGYTGDPEQDELLIGANGIPVWQSYIAGLDPTDPASVFMLDLSDALPGDEIVLRWAAVSGRVYSIYRMNQPGQTPEALPDAQDLPWPRDSYTNRPGEETSGILQLRVRLP